LHPKQSQGLVLSSLGDAALDLSPSPLGNGMIDLARKILLHDRGRFLITVGGVGFSVALVLLQTGLFLGLMDNASITIDRMDADIWIADKNTPNIDFARTFSDSYVNRVRAIDGVARADNLIVWFIRMALPNGVQEGIECYGMERFEDWKMPWDVAEGDLSDLRRGRYLMLDDSATHRCGEFAVGQWREFLGTRMKIVGRTRGALSFTTAPIGFMDIRSMQDLTPDLRGQTTYIVVKLMPGANRERVMADLARLMPHSDVHTREEWSRMTRVYWMMNTGLGMNLGVTVLLGCVVALVIVGQTLYTSTMEHIKEFGTIKAIGAGNGHIYGILARQSTIAAVLGFGIGASITLLISPLATEAGLKMIMLPQLWLAAAVGTLVLCLSAGMISFRKVAGLDPAMVFRG
jgi:putative ABC transport system permease protein